MLQGVLLLWCAGVLRVTIAVDPADIDHADSRAVVARYVLAHRAFRPSGFDRAVRSEEHTSELQSLMRNSYAVFCLKQKILLHTPQKTIPLQHYPTHT